MSRVVLTYSLRILRPVVGTLFLVLGACAPGRAPAPAPVLAPVFAPVTAAAAADARARTIARAVANFERFGRADNGWSPPRPVKHHAEQLREQARVRIDSYNRHDYGDEGGAEVLLSAAEFLLFAERLADSPTAAYLDLGRAIQVLKHLLEFHPHTPSSERAMLAVAVGFWRLGTYDDRAQHWFEALTREFPTGVCAQLAFIAIGDELCRRGAKDEANLRYTRAQEGANPVAARLAAAREGCRELEAPLGPGFYRELHRSTGDDRWRCH